MDKDVPYMYVKTLLEKLHYRCEQRIVFMYVYTYGCKELWRNAFVYWMTDMNTVSRGLSDIIDFKMIGISSELTTQIIKIYIEV
jgi:hypothetical protein